MQKLALAIHDLSCMGRSSLTVALPILSAAGVNTGVIPTALLSTHTGEFTGYTHLDLSGQLYPIASHIQKLGLHFDAIYTGYMANEEQCQMVSQIIRMLADKETHILVDPAFGDCGSIYNLLSTAMPESMLELCSYARTIVPNLTEASFMLGIPYSEHITRSEVSDYCVRLREKGIRNVIITDVRPSPTETGVAFFGENMAAPDFLFHKLYKGMFYGTGDAFASFLLGALLKNMPLKDAVKLALEMICHSIEETIQNGLPSRYGLCFEMVLGEYISRLKPEKS